jgi:hypothetical protein
MQKCLNRWSFEIAIAFIVDDISQIKNMNSSSTKGVSNSHEFEIQEL